MEQFTISLVGLPVGITLRCSGYQSYFAPFRSNEAPVAHAEVTDTARRAAFPLYKAALAHTGMLPTDAYVEEAELCSKVCDALLPFDRAIFHAVAFEWRGKAWLFAAPSGTGKTTQYKLWKYLFEPEVQMLNGDKPVLRFRADDVLVCPSPWAGKENMAQARTAPLGGVILLAQANENRMLRLTPQAATVRIFSQFMSSMDTPEQVQQIAAMAHRLLQRVPVWLLRNRGDPDSARLAHDTLEKELKLG